MIVVNEKHLEAIRSHGEATYPNECGGMLIGNFEDNGNKTVVETFPLENASEENQRNRVLLLPKDVMRAEKHARENKLDVIGYYHSHPDDRAVPSQFDLDHALPCLVIHHRFSERGKGRRCSVMGNGRRPFEV